jgi:hypothetical protein
MDQIGEHVNHRRTIVNGIKIHNVEAGKGPRYFFFMDFLRVGLPHEDYAEAVNELLMGLPGEWCRRVVSLNRLSNNVFFTW